MNDLWKQRPPKHTHTHTRKAFLGDVPFFRAHTRKKLWQINQIFLNALKTAKNASNEENTKNKHLKKRGENPHRNQSYRLENDIPEQDTWRRQIIEQIKTSCNGASHARWRNVTRTQSRAASENEISIEPFKKVFLIEFEQRYLFCCRVRQSNPSITRTHTHTE